MSEATHVGSGKVRELYALDTDRLLLVASDRISTFDVVLPTEIPDKGRVLTGLSGFWFARTNGFVPNHLLELRDDGRSTECRRLEMLPIECVVRGYLAGSGWKDYLATGAVCGHTLPAGLGESEQLPEPIFTPATKAQSGHDENIDRAAAVELVGRERFDEVERTALELYAFVSDYARARGIILADTKLEFGIDETGQLVLGDEAFTPDSSRFWPVDDYEPGRHATLVRQAVRPRLLRDARLGQDGSWAGAPGGRRRRHARALHRGVRAPDRDPLRGLRRATRAWCSHEGDGARPAQAGHPRSAGPGRRELAPPPRLRRSPRRASAGWSTSSSRPTIASRRSPRSSRCASACWPTR